MHLLPPSLSPPSLPLSIPTPILHSGRLPFFLDVSSCCLTEGCDVGTTTRGHYDTPASRPDGDFVWGGGTWTGMNGENDDQELHGEGGRGVHIVQEGRGQKVEPV